jgi:hypothetical protein
MYLITKLQIELANELQVSQLIHGHME